MIIWPCQVWILYSTLNTHIVNEALSYLRRVGCVGTVLSERGQSSQDSQHRVWEVVPASKADSNSIAVAFPTLL